MDAIQNYLAFFRLHGPFSSRETIIETVLVLLMMLVLLILNKEKWSSREKIGRVVVWSYLYLIFLFTFLARSSTDVYHYNLNPFWTYLYIQRTHDFEIVLEVLINCLMFVPVGILVPWTYKEYLHEDPIKERNAILLFGLVLSLSVEILQLITRTGLFEWDDIIHNIFGLIWGYGLYLWLQGKKFSEIHHYFLPVFGVALALLVVML
ncbi:VanZ family protein [Eubacteriaceae bacterium ES2]|nr:VanZ family protein [Eubacteriaceae bacterium ES2]